MTFQEAIDWLANWRKDWEEVTNFDYCLVPGDDPSDDAIIKEVPEATHYRFRVIEGWKVIEFGSAKAYGAALASPIPQAIYPVNT